MPRIGSPCLHDWLDVSRDDRIYDWYTSALIDGDAGRVPGNFEIVITKYTPM